MRGIGRTYRSNTAMPLPTGGWVQFFGYRNLELSSSPRAGSRPNILEREKNQNRWAKNVGTGSKTAIPTALEKRLLAPLLPSFAAGVESHIALAVRAVHA